MAKTLTSFACVILLNWFRTEGWYSVDTHTISIAFMAINVGEAVYEEVSRGLYLNAGSALLMLMAMPFDFPREEIELLQRQTKISALYLFPYPLSWIIVYTSWNACFSFGCNMSWMTRLVLIPPLIVCCIHNDINLWLGGRILLLMFHLFMRASKCVWLYQPGNSFLTPDVGSISNDPESAQAWGAVNLALACVLLFLT